MLATKFLISLYITLVQSEDIFYNINLKKVFHTVSDKFLSISVDPGVLLAGVNLSDTSLLLARHLGPAYIRLAGPSTPYVKFVDDDDHLHTPNMVDVLISPSMWFGINEWLNLAKLTPVFGINDAQREKGIWNPDSLLPLLEMSDKFGVKCFWQLGYDCSNKTAVQYVEDLNILRQTLKRFPGHDDSWKIAGSDLSKCAFDEVTNGNLENYLKDLEENVDAVMWESSLIPKSELKLEKTALWTAMPKNVAPVTFVSAMEFIKQVEKAAYAGYDVIFREPRLREITKDSPVYWASFLYKKLIGPVVLESRPLTVNVDLHSFAHCTRHQNSYARSGAITILVINNSTEAGNVYVHLNNIIMEKSMEIQVYFLTSANEDPLEVFLNDQKLTMDHLKLPHDEWLKPKLRRTKIRSYVPLEVPPKCIAFFVLTGARCSLCSEGKEELDNILEEINEDQEEPSSMELPFNIEQRLQKTGKSHATKVTLEEIKRNMLDEIELDKKYHEKMIKTDSIIDDIHRKSKVGFENKNELLNRHLKAFVEKSRRGNTDKNGIFEKSDDKSSDFRVPSNRLFLTIKEIESILKQRAKTKAAQKNIKLTSAELDMLVNKASIHLPKQKRDINHLLLEEKANFHKNNQFSQEHFEKFAKSHRNSPKIKLSRRDINLDLLKEKTKPESTWSRSKIAKQPKPSVLRKYWEEQENKRGTMDIEDDSHELFKNMMDSDELDIYDFQKGGRTFTDFASSEEALSSEWFQPSKPKCKHKNSFERNMPANTRNKHKEIRYGPRDGFQFMEESDEGGGGRSHVKKLGWSWNDPTKKFSELWEMKYGKSDRAYNDMSVFNGLDEFNFFDDLDYAIIRSKRDSNIINKEISSISPISSRKKCKKNCKNGQRRTKNANKSPRKQTTNQQDKNATVNKIILEADLNENTIPPPRMKRSLLDNNIPNLFGQYKPLTLGLKPWKPADVVGLASNPNFFPLYALLQRQNLNNRLLQAQYFGLRRRKRYINEHSLNSLENYAVSKEDSNEKNSDGKIEWTKNLGALRHSNIAKWVEYPGDLNKKTEFNLKKNKDNNVDKLHSSRIPRIFDDVPKEKEDLQTKPIWSVIYNKESKKEIEQSDDDVNKIVVEKEQNKHDHAKVNLENSINSQELETKEELFHDRDQITFKSNASNVSSSNVPDFEKELGENEAEFSETDDENNEETVDNFKLLKNIIKNILLKRPRENIEQKEDRSENQIKLLENLKNSTLSSMESVVSQTKSFFENSEKAALRSPNYLDRILGERNVKSLEDFASKVKGYFDTVGNNVKLFFGRLF